MGSALASGVTGTGIDPSVGKETSMSEHAIIRDICRDDMKTVRRPSDLDVNWKPTLCRVIHLMYRLKNSTVIQDGNLSPFKLQPGVYNVHRLCLPTCVGA